MLFSSDTGVPDLACLLRLLFFFFGYGEPGFGESDCHFGSMSRGHIFQFNTIPFMIDNAGLL